MLTNIIHLFIYFIHTLSVREFRFTFNDLVVYFLLNDEWQTTKISMSYVDGLLKISRSIYFSTHTIILNENALLKIAHSCYVVVRCIVTITKRHFVLFH